MALPQRLKQLRCRYGYSQAQTADMLSVSRMAYTQYESGRSDPSLENLILLAKVYNVSMDYLLGLSDIPRLPVLDSQESFLLSQLDTLTSGQRYAVFQTLAQQVGEQILKESG